MPPSSRHVFALPSAVLCRLSALALVLSVAGACSDDDQRDRYFGTDAGTTFEVTAPPDTAPALDAAAGEAGDTTDAADVGGVAAEAGGDAADSRETASEAAAEAASETGVDVGLADGPDAASD